MQDRIDELEVKLAFQEDLLETLNTIVAKQQVQLDLLQDELRLVYQQLKSLQLQGSDQPVDEPPPPHY